MLIAAKCWAELKTTPPASTSTLKFLTSFTAVSTLNCVVPAALTNVTGAMMLVPAGVIPRTTSGKLARRACRAQYLNGELGLRGHS